MVTKFFGFSEGNDVRLSHNDVSGKHARISLLEDGTFLVEDLDSRSGTFVNGFQVRKAIALKGDIVELSKHKLDLDKIFGLNKIADKPKSNSTDYTNEYLELKNVLSDYKNLKQKLVVGRFRRIAITRTTIILIPQLIAVFIHFVLEIPVFGSPVYITITLASSLGSNWYNPNSVKDKEKDEEIEIHHKLRWVCPGCRFPLPSPYWEVNFTSHRTCRNCKAVWNNEK